LHPGNAVIGFALIRMEQPFRSYQKMPVVMCPGIRRDDVECCRKSAGQYLSSGLILARGDGNRDRVRAMPWPMRSLTQLMRVRKHFTKSSLE
ncbi:MAG TPA: hypothetical protein VN065_13780, partial [Bradyrhizobium sp.]|nr:hypothetical protein [Bradyrhizobium sp.]